MSRNSRTLLAAGAALIFTSAATGTELYYSHWDWPGAIYRMDCDTLESELVTGDTVYSLRLAVDPVGGKIYWIESYVGQICRANLDGTHVEVVLDGCTSGG